jgi:hypothetical protein
MSYKFNELYTYFIIISHNKVIYNMNYSWYISLNRQNRSKLANLPTIYQSTPRGVILGA